MLDTNLLCSFFRRVSEPNHTIVVIVIPPLPSRFRLLLVPFLLFLLFLLIFFPISFLALIRAILVFVSPSGGLLCLLYVLFADIDISECLRYRENTWKYIHRRWVLEDEGAEFMAIVNRTPATARFALKFY